MKRESDAKDATSSRRWRDASTGDDLHIMAGDAGVVESDVTGRRRRWNGENFARSGFVIANVTGTSGTDDGQTRDSDSEMVVMNVIVVTDVISVGSAAPAAAVQYVNVLKRIGQFSVRRRSATPHDAEWRLRRIVRRRRRPAIARRRRQSPRRNTDCLPVIRGSAFGVNN